MDKKNFSTALQWFIQECVPNHNISWYIHNLYASPIDNNLKFIDINLLKGYDLVFVDIEATDDKQDRKFIQFSGVKFNQLSGEINEINIVINPEQPLTDYIINLLKIDDEYLSNKPTWNEVKHQIGDFLNHAVMVSFGDFDINITKRHLDLDTYDIKFFDFQSWLKQFSKNNVGLLEIAKLLYDDVESAYQHNALFDAYLLSDIFHTLKDMSPEAIKHLALLSHIIPRRVIPKHKIFSTVDFSNKWENKISSDSKPFSIDTLIIKTFTYKTRKTKHVIPYLYEFKAHYLENDEIKTLKWKNKIAVGQHTYDLHLDSVNRFFNIFLSVAHNKAIFFNDCGKDKITSLVEIIYDATKKYVALNFANLSYLNRKFKDPDGLKLFNQVMSESSEEIRTKFKGFYQN